MGPLNTRALSLSNRQQIIVLTCLIVLVILLDWLSGQGDDVTVHQAGDLMGPQFGGFDMPGLYAPDFSGRKRCPTSHCGCTQGPPLTLSLPPMPTPPILTIQRPEQVIFDTYVPEFDLPLEQTPEYEDWVPEVKVPTISVPELEANYTPRPRMTIHKEQSQTGYQISFDGPTPNLKKIGMNDRTRSLTIHSGFWELCRDINYGGECRVFGPGTYSGLEDMGRLYKNVTSMRPVTQH